MNYLNLKLPKFSFSEVLTSPKSQKEETSSKLEESSSVLNFPGKDASDDERSKFNDRVAKSAVESSVLTITDCKSEPLVLKARENSEITISNKDDKVNRLNLDNEHSYSIAAKSSIKLTLNFGKGPGTYGYSCGSQPPTGIFLITGGK